MPKISVVMPAYNSEKYIAEAIESILNQTFTDFEFIIINDGSTDRTEEIILSYNDERIVYLKNEKNMGIVYTLNRGLDTAKGEYIARMDSDDISLPTRFEEQIEYLEKHPEITVLGTAINIFGEEIDEYTFIFSRNPKKSKAELLFSPSLAHPTVMIKKSVIDINNLRYKETFAGLEDSMLWWQISHFGEICSLEKPLLNYRQHKSQITANRTIEKEQKAKKFLLIKINTFNIDFSNEEFESLHKYHIGSFSDIMPRDVENLISLFKKLLNSNKNIKYFNQYCFKKVLSLAILYSINFLKCSAKEKSKIRTTALKGGVLSLELFLKTTILYFLKHY